MSNLTRLLAATALAACLPASSQAACCYFSAKNADILQPAQKVFITWDPSEKVETLTVQPKFEGNALDFGMVIPTPSQPKLSEMPRDFFKHLAIYTIMRRREFAQSRLLPLLEPELRHIFRDVQKEAFSVNEDALAADPKGARKPAIKILEVGTVGSLDYKIIEAGRADDLFKWLTSSWLIYELQMLPAAKSSKGAGSSKE